MSESLEPDLCILGGGATGASLAAQASAQGLSVVLVENHGVGGSKLAYLASGHALLAASRYVAELRDSERFGVVIGEPRVDFARIQRQNAALAAALSRNETEARLEALNVKIIMARGQFASPDQLDAGRFEIKARQFVIATGAQAKILPIRGIELIRPLTYESLCGLKILPPRLLVLGEEPFGLALAQGFRRLGSDVTVLTESKVFASVDDELAAPVRAEFARDGVLLAEGETISQVEPHKTGFRIFPAGGTSGQRDHAAFEGSHLLLAAGMAPLVEGLGLAAAQVRYDARGIVVDPNLRTSNRRVFAMGSVARSTYSGASPESQAGLVLNALLGRPTGPAPSVEMIMTDPEIAVAGLSEAEARARHQAIRVLRWPFAETDRARCQRATAGHVKMITTAGGTIIGAGVVGAAAGELISLCTFAISNGMTAAEFQSMIVPYPVLADALRCAAAGFGSPGSARSLPPHGLRLWHRLGRGVP